MNLHYQPAGTASREFPAFDATIEVLAGGLWVTRLGDAEDYLLGPGDSLKLRGGDDVALESTEHGVTTVWRWCGHDCDAGRAAGVELRHRATARGVFAALARSAVSVARFAQASVTSGSAAR